MTQQEFDDWFEVHCLRFTGVARLLGDEPTIAQVYFERLQDFDQATVMAATDEMFAMDIDLFPSQHLGKLISICRASRYRSKADPVNLPDKPIPDCAKCGDRGVIYVFHPMAYKKIRDEQFDANTDMQEIVVSCNCARGQQHCNKSPENVARKDSFANMKLFDENTMLPVDGNTEADLIEFVTIRWAPRNYNHEFAAFA